MELKKYVHKPTIVYAYKAMHDDVITTLEGDMKIHPGDYVVKGSDGKSIVPWPVNQEVFDKLYEEIKEEDSPI